MCSLHVLITLSLEGHKHSYGGVQEDGVCLAWGMLALVVSAGVPLPHVPPGKSVWV